MFVKLVSDLRNVKFVGFDTETRGLVDKTIVGFSLAYRKGPKIIRQYYPLNHKYIDNVDKLQAQVFLKWLFQESGLRIIMHNAAFDLEVIAGLNIDISKTAVDDTMIMGHLLDERVKDGLKERVLMEFGHQMMHFKDVCGTGQKAITFDEVQSEKMAHSYASEDAYYTFLLFLKYHPLLNANKKLLSVYETIERPLINVVVDMHIKGIRVDKNKVKEIQEYCQRQVEFALSKLEVLMPGINLNSSKQLREYFIGQKGLAPLTFSGKTGEPAVDKEFFEKYQDNYKVKAEMKAILAYRKYNKLLSTFVPALSPTKDDIIYPRFRQVGTISGRFSSSDPNAQNIPRADKDEEEISIRAAFIPREGYIFIDADYSQIELRVAAILSQDPLLLKAYRNGQDIHQLTADTCGCSRQHAKTLNFGLLYGIQERALAKQLQVPERQAAEYWDKYWKTYKTLHAFIRGKEKEVYQAKELYTAFGRRRLLSNYFHKMKPYEQGAHLRSLTNSIIQGTSADILKQAMVIMYPKLKDLGAYILLTVHDEVLVECPQDKKYECGQIIYAAMFQAKQILEIPFEVALGFGENWEIAHTPCQVAKDTGQTVLKASNKGFTIIELEA
jgi:DNA polymerase-1